MTQISVVRYYTEPDPTMVDTGPAPNRLMREVNFSAVASPVAYLEDFQVVYRTGVSAATPAGFEEHDPRDPQPAAGVAITSADIINGVQISVGARSLTPDLQGSTKGATVADGNFIRKTFSSNVNPRNISSGLAFRTKDDPLGPSYQ